MCTAATYRTKDFYFGRTLDYDFSYGDEVVITPRNFPFHFIEKGTINSHFAMIGMSCVMEGYPLYYDAVNENGLGMAGLNFVGNAFYNESRKEKDNIAQFEFIPWILCQCTNVKEARSLLERINMLNVSFNDRLPVAQLHYIISDKNESITVEPLKEGIKVYENPVGVLTNNPPFDMQMLMLNNYMNLSAGPPENRFAKKLCLKEYGRGMGAIGLPGDLSSQSRFVRAAFVKMNSVSGEGEEEIMSEINKLGLYQGILKNKVNANKIIDSLRLENEKIAWIGMKIEGTNAKITIVEATEKPEIIDENEYCNIVASKEGIITKVNVTNGTAVCKPGDVVEKGDKLIEGWMEGKYTGVRYMHASGEIEARVWYTAEKTESYIQTENEKTGEEENRYSIIFNKKQINFYKTLSKFKKYDTIKIDKKIKLFNNFYLPIEFRKSTNYEYKEVERQYTSEALKEKILTELEEQIKENLTDKEIANKDVIIEEQNGAMKVRLIYEVLEKIGVEEKLVS